jgi:hypothetical protein
MNTSDLVVYRHLPGGSIEEIGRTRSAVEAIQWARTETDGLAARLGLVTQVTIIDGQDHTIFGWKSAVDQEALGVVDRVATELAFAISELVQKSRASREVRQLVVG